MKPLARAENLADVRARILLRADLSQDTRRGLASNLKRFCEIVGVPEALVPCDAAHIRGLMKEATPAAYGVTKVNWGKIRSGVWRTLAIVGVKLLRGTGIELNDELAALFNGVPMHPHRTELTPISKFVLDQKLSVWSLTQADVPVLREWMKARYTKTCWTKPYRKTLARWRLCQSEFASQWPQALLQPEYEERDWADPWSAMPRLESVVDAHLEELRRPKKRRHGGSRRLLAETTLIIRKGYVRRLASAMRISLGTAPETLEQLTDPASVEAGVDHIMKMREVEVSGDVCQMLRHINAIARHHVRRPKHELDELTAIRKSVMPPQGPAEKNRKLLEKFRDPGLRDLFVRAPGKVLRNLSRKPNLDRADLNSGMLALLAALLTKVPMRISEVMALKYGETLHDHGTGRKRQVVIDVPADLVKNGVPRHAKLGAELIALLDIYERLVRHRLAADDNPHLFPSSGTGARSSDHISKQLAAWSTRHIIRMTAHQWRHVVGYIFLRENPGCYETVRRLLGHRSITTTVQFYAFMLEDDANEALDRTIDTLINAAGRRRHSPKRGK